MDIDQWLQETAPATSPSQHLQGHAFGHHDQEATRLGRHSRCVRKRKSLYTNSSLIDGYFQKVPSLASETKGHNTWLQRHRETGLPSDDNGSSITTSSTSALTSSGSPSKQESTIQGAYKKRSRHKTRADKYETKKRKDYSHRREPKSRRSEHKSNKRRKEKTGPKHAQISGNVQVFHAKNVGKNRLTLDPAKAGLYTYGRASAPTHRRGAGLPDLTFSEMRFLNNHEFYDKDQSRDQANNKPNKKGKKKKKKKKNDHSHAEEVTISAFFGSTRNMHNSHIKLQEEHKGPSRRKRRPASLLHEVQDSVVVFPSTPFLGFGSRGAPQENTSHLTRSDSIYSDEALSKPHAMSRPIVVASMNLVCDSITGDRRDDAEVHEDGEVSQVVGRSHTPVKEASVGNEVPCVSDTAKLRGSAKGVPAQTDGDSPIQSNTKVNGDQGKASNASNPGDMPDAFQENAAVNLAAHHSDEKMVQKPTTRVKADAEPSLSPLKILLQKCGEVGVVMGLSSERPPRQHTLEERIVPGEPLLELGSRLLDLNSTHLQANQRPAMFREHLENSGGGQHHPVLWNWDATGREKIDQAPDYSHLSAWERGSEALFNDDQGSDMDGVLSHGPEVRECEGMDYGWPETLEDEEEQQQQQQQQQDRSTEGCWDARETCPNGLEDFWRPNRLY